MKMSVSIGIVAMAGMIVWLGVGCATPDGDSAAGKSTVVAPRPVVVKPAPPAAAPVAVAPAPKAAESRPAAAEPKSAADKEISTITATITNMKSSSQIASYIANVTKVEGGYLPEETKKIRVIFLRVPKGPWTQGEVVTINVQPHLGGGWQVLDKLPGKVLLFPEEGGE